jgi:small-conductance mechanosensitive channel
MIGTWQWFTINSIQILSIAACALCFSILSWSLIQTRIKKWSPEKWLKSITKLTSLLHWFIEGISLAFVAAAAVAIVLSREGVHGLITTDMINEWVVKHGIFIFVIILVSYIVYYIFKRVLPKLVESSVKTRGKGRKAKAEMAKRSETLTSMLSGIIGVIIITIALFSILDEAGVPIAPLLAGAGIVGIAVGFGAQHLIKDFLNGLFILLEDQYNKGDVVKIAGVSGQVEEITLRRTTLRDLDGLVHSIPNGEITTASNYTKGWSRVNLDISVSYQENLDHVIDIINKVCETLASDEYFKAKILKTPQVLRISNFGSSGIDIKILGDTQPLAQWEVTGEIRKRIKKAFDEEGIEIPWPHVKLFFGQEKTTETILCNTCKHHNIPGNRFCSNCGSPLHYLKVSSVDTEPASPPTHEPVKEDTGN